MNRTSSSFHVKSTRPSRRPVRSERDGSRLRRRSAHRRCRSKARLIVKMLEPPVVRLPDRALSRRASRNASGTGLPHAEIALANWKVCDAALKRGDIGFGETYIAGDWSTPDLLALMNVMVANRNAIEAVIYGTWWGRLLYRIRHLTRRNTRTGSKKQHPRSTTTSATRSIALWLDESMTYSSALFGDRLRRGRPHRSRDDLDDAAVRRRSAKYNARDRRTRARGRCARVLEIGCGWGGFAGDGGASRTARSPD